MIGRLHSQHHSTDNNSLLIFLLKQYEEMLSHAKELRQ